MSCSHVFTPSYRHNPWMVIFAAAFAATLGAYIGFQEHLGQLRMVKPIAAAMVPLFALATIATRVLSPRQDERCPICKTHQSVTVSSKQGQWLINNKKP